MPEKTLTVKELATFFRVTPDTVRGWVRDDRIPAIRISPKCTRFDLSEVRAALNENAAVEAESPQ